MDSFKRYHIYMLEIVEEERKNRVKEILEVIVIENFPKLMTGTKA